MRTLRCFLFMVCLLLLFAVNADANLVAPVYPGSVEAPHEISEMNEPFLKAYYTKDPIEKVLEFYEGKIGKFKEGYKKQSYSNLFKKIDPTDELVKKAPLIFADGKIRPAFFGVRIVTQRPEKPLVTQGTAGVCRTHKYFDYLKELIAILKTKSDKDLDEVCKKYSHITWKYFMSSKVLDKKGKPLTYAEAKIEKFVKEEKSMDSASTDAEAMSKKIGELMQQGKMAEAMELSKKMGQQMSESMDKTDADWDKFIDLLNDVDKNAYKTLIFIHIDI